MKTLALPVIILRGLAAAALVVSACGGEESDGSQGDAGPCGPHGNLHRGAGADPHCHCDDGYYVLNGTCVEETFEADEPDEPTMQTRDCGEGGTFNGRSCECDRGFGRTGIGSDQTCSPIPACQGANDVHEPNDVPSQAVWLDEPEGSLYACPADRDWFVFEVTAGDRVRVELKFDGTSVDLDLLAFGPSSADPRGISDRANSDYEVVEFVARADGTGGILVLPYGTGEGAYELTVTIEVGDAPACSAAGRSCRASSDCCSGWCHVGHCH